MDIETSLPEPPGRLGTLEELDEATCRSLLASAYVGRVIHMVGGRPQVALVNIAMDHGDVVVRCLPGTRLGAALSTPGTEILVEADEVDPDTRTGWSVVARGRMRAVLDQVAVAGLDRHMPPSWVLGDHGGTWVRMSIDEMTGRRVTATRSTRP